MAPLAVFGRGAALSAGLNNIWSGSRWPVGFFRFKAAVYRLVYHWLKEPLKFLKPMDFSRLLFREHETNFSMHLTMRFSTIFGIPDVSKLFLTTIDRFSAPHKQTCQIISEIEINRF